jgi:hypothetical protein
MDRSVMTEPLTREQFRAAVADAVSGVLNVYREVDAMFRDLTIALNDAEARFVPLIKRMVPGAGSKNPDARYLRNYQAAIFAPADATEDDDEDDDEEDEDVEDGEDEDVETPKTAKRALTLKVGSALLVARAAIYDRSRPTFEPALTVGVLARCRVDSNTPAGTVLKTKAGRFKRIFRAIDAHRGAAGKPLLTAVTAQIVGPSKSKNSKLTFDTPTPMRAYPLFEITADNIRNVVEAVRSDWAIATSEPPPTK